MSNLFKFSCPTVQIGPRRPRNCHESVRIPFAKIASQWRIGGGGGRHPLKFGRLCLFYPIFIRMLKDKAQIRREYQNPRELPGPLSGPWTMKFTLRARDVRERTIFCTPPPPPMEILDPPLLHLPFIYGTALREDVTEALCC